MVLIFGRENVKSAKGVKHKEKNFWWLTSMLCVIIPSSTYYIGNLEFAKLVPGEAHFYDLNGDEIEKEATEIKWNAEAEYSCAVTPQIRQAGNRLSGFAETAYASLLA